MMEAKQASVDRFPEFDSLNKMPLQRCVQLEKRHRDKIFYEDKSKAPSSIIITTLTVYSYAYAVRNNRYDHPLELMIDVVEGLPNFIKVIPLGSGVTDTSCRTRSCRRRISRRNGKRTRNCQKTSLRGNSGRPRAYVGWLKWRR